MVALAEEVGRMQEGQQGEERHPPCLSCFLPFFPTGPLPETRISDRTLVVGSRWRFPSPYSLPPSLHLPVSTLSHALFGSPKGGRALFPLPESINTSSQLPLIVPWLRAERNRTLFTEDFLHAVWESALISLGDSRCCTTLLLTLAN